MLKDEMLEAVAAESNVPKKEVAAVIAAFSKVLIEKVWKKDDTFRLPELGIFSVKHTKQRTGRNPSTQKEMIIPAKNVATFKASKGVKDALNAK